MRSLLRHLALCLLFPALAAAQAPPSSTVPSDSNNRAHAAWNDACRARVAAAKDGPVDILFVGDSITESWTASAWGGEDRGLAVWNARYVPRNALDFGVGADATQNILWRLDTMDVQSLHPKVIVLLAGTNNTRDTALDIAAGVHAVLGKLRQMYPAARVILVSIMPNRRADALMMDADTILKSFADNRTVFYLDLVPLMPPEGDNWKGLGKDHLHPNEAGYRIWADAMEPLLTKLLAAH
jgi:lysophospholipase L1-like esterase